MKNVIESRDSASKKELARTRPAEPSGTDILLDIRPGGGTLHAASASSRPADDGKQFSVADRRFLPCAASPARKRRTKNQLRRNSRNERVLHLPVASSMSWDGLHARRPLECPGTTAKHNDESSAFTSINAIPVNTPQNDVVLKRGFTGSPTPPFPKNFCEAWAQPLSAAFDKNSVTGFTRVCGSRFVRRY